MNKLGKSICVLVVLLLFVFQTANGLNALYFEPFEVDGIYYKFEHGGLCVTHKGYASTDYKNEYSGEVVIPDYVLCGDYYFPVKAIGDSAFYECDKLSTVVLPDSIKYIGDASFEYCSGLTSINIPDSVTYLGDSSFHLCSSLTSVKLPNTITKIYSGTFCGCKELKEIDIPKSVDLIGYAAFSGCSALKSLKIGNSVNLIDGNAFSGCNSLQSVYIEDLESWCKIEFVDNISNPLRYATQLYVDGTLVTHLNIPDKVTSIGEYAFCGWKALESATIPNSVTSIGRMAFDDTPFYNNMPDGVIYLGSVLYNYKGTMPDNCHINIKDGTVSISSHAFYNCSGLTSVTIPNSVTSIGDFAFYDCSGLTSVTIPNSVTSIGDFAFFGCSGLTSVTIGNSVTSIGDYAFEYCSGLTSVTIPNSVTSIGSYAFYNCSGLTSVQFNAENCSDLSGNYRWLSGCKNITSFTFGENVKTIPANLCYDLSKLTSVVIPNSVTSIGDYAFYKCSGLTSVTIPNSVTSIGSSAFRYCSGLTSVTIPNSVASIGDYAFSGCSGLTSIVVAKENTFYDSRDNCNAIIETKSNTLIAGCENTIIPESVTSIGDYAFYNCRGLTSVAIPNSVTSIGDYAFRYCSGLTSVQFNAENCSGLSGYYNWLSDCKNITSFTFGENVKTIPAYLCYGLSKLNHVTIPNSVTSIGDFAFYKCSGLTSVTIPNSVTSIGRSAFYYCSGLTYITIPNSVTSIGDFAFYDCSGLTSIQCDAITPPSLGNNVFYNVDKMACTLIVPEESVEAYKAANQWKDFLNVSGVEEIAIEDSNISVENGMIINRNNEIIEIYNLSGAKVYAGSDAEVSLTGGMYIVKAGNKVVKIAL